MFTGAKPIAAEPLSQRGQACAFSSDPSAETMWTAHEVPSAPPLDRPTRSADAGQWLLSRALTNLPSNALRHTHQGTNLELRRLASAGSSKSRSATMAPAPVAEPDNLLRRFARGESTHSILELSLVAAGASAMRANATISSRGGFAVAIRLPAGSDTSRG